MKKDEIPHLEEQLAYLATVKDEDIDFSDIPEITDFSNAIRGDMFRPLKKAHCSQARRRHPRLVQEVSSEIPDSHPQRMV